MKVLLIGSGGREHSIALKLSQSPRLTQLYIAPGNPGTEQVGINVPIGETQIDELIQFAKKEKIDLTFVGPEGPLAAGIVDRFQAEKLAIVGPDLKGAQLESSKKWAKEIMIKNHIPTAAYQAFTDLDSALGYLRHFPVVIKADGLAAGKGVTIALSFDEARQALEDCFLNSKFGQAGNQVVIEEFLTGDEASILAFTDGKTILAMAPAQDHKAIFDGDKGPNTGGMGSYCPAPLVTPALEKEVLETVFKPLLKGLQQEGITYKGIIYAGLMICKGKPYVIEFNARFGDPETQVVLPQLKTDLLDIFVAMNEGKLDQIRLEWADTTTVCVVLASKGYPGEFEKGKIIRGLHPGVIHAGTLRQAQGTVVTNGGRVLGVIGQDKEMGKAIEKAYQEAEKIQFEGKYFRTDIGKRRGKYGSSE